MSRDHDVVLYGATGYVGALIAEHLARNAPATATIALGGRSQHKLEQLRDRLPGAAKSWPIVIADAADREQLRSMAASATVVATTVGPYAKYGMPLVEACAENGTHYADLTGETQFHRAAIDTYGKQAADTGAKIVHSCGYDSIPSDLGVYLLAKAAGEPLAEVTATAYLKGGLSGGTVDSMRTMVDEVRADKELRKLMFDPFGLSPDRAAETSAKQPSDTPRPANATAAGPRRSSWRPTTRGSSAAATPCSTGSTARSCATRRSWASAPAGSRR